jgi:hypothetical protein
LVQLFHEIRRRIEKKASKKRKLFYIKKFSANDYSVILKQTIEIEGKSPYVGKVK